MTCTIRTRLTSFALAAVVACTSFGFAAADSAEAASKRKAPVTKTVEKKSAKKGAKKRAKNEAKASGRKIG